jgi:ribosomal protein S18 acetylase RimI-like enzyme
VNRSACVRVGTVDDLRAVGHLWKELNDYHHTVGMNFQTGESSVDEWISSFERTLGRFSYLWVAEKEGSVKGFLLGRLKRTPAYLGGVMIGEISDLYIGEDLRGQGIGKKLVDTALKQFIKQHVHSVEVQIMAHNTNGLAFWNSIGFQEDVILVRRMINPVTDNA